jgi:hypothetical protein
MIREIEQVTGEQVTAGVSSAFQELFVGEHFLRSPAPLFCCLLL